MKTPRQKRLEMQCEREPAFRQDGIVVVLVLSLLTTDLVATRAGASLQNPPPHALAGLHHQNGWILIGAFDVSSQRWASLLKHTSVPRDGRPRPLVPSAGDTIEMVSEIDVYIVDYGTRGEDLRMESPALRRLTKADATGIVLTPGTRLQVQRIERGAVTGTLQLVWAMVTP
jgi:hypothetical protein